MKKLSSEEAMSFIREGSQTAKLATVRKDGRPHCVPVWCCFGDDDSILFMTRRLSIKGKNIARENRVAMTFDDEAFPYGFVAIDGRAEFLEASPEELLDISIRIAARYVPPERADEFGKRNATPEEVVVKVTPTNIFAITGIAE